MFKERLALVANVSPCVADLIYTALCIDGAAAQHPETQQRLHLIYMGEKGLLTDLRHLNAGRPSDRFDVFFNSLVIVMEQVTAADERRHTALYVAASAHLSEWISLKEIVKKTEELCPLGTLVPSISLVRLQFAP